MSYHREKPQYCLNRIFCNLALLIIGRAVAAVFLVGPIPKSNRAGYRPSCLHAAHHRVGCPQRYGGHRPPYILTARLPMNDFS